MELRDGQMECEDSLYCSESAAQVTSAICLNSGGTSRVDHELMRIRFHVRFNRDGMALEGTFALVHLIIVDSNGISGTSATLFGTQ